METPIVYEDIVIEEMEQEDEYILVKGYANKYIDNGEVVIDDAGTSFRPASFDLSSYEKNPIVLFEHDISVPVGKAVVIKQTDKGLYVELKVFKEVNPYVYSLVKNGVISTFSVGTLIKAEFYSELLEAYIVEESELREISLVTLPSNTASVIEKVDLCSLGACTVLRNSDLTLTKEKHPVDKAMITKMLKEILK